jgi:hypothetical protein
MVWSSVVAAVITAGAAFIGVGYGARLSTRSETTSWTREQRLKAYIELLNAVEKCYEAFTLIAASLSLVKYGETVRTDPKIINTSAEWGKWDEEIDRFLPQAELVCSESLWPYITYIRLGIRSRQRMLLMKLTYGQEISEKEWEFVSSKTHGDILEIRRRLREDITHIDSGPTPFAPTIPRFRRMRRRIIKKLRVIRPAKDHTLKGSNE